MITTLSADHPGRLLRPAGELVRLVVHDGEPWLAYWKRSAGLVLVSIGSDDAAAPPAPRIAPHELPCTTDARPLVRMLATLGNVQRLTNPSLWDAITTAILRQVVRAGQARGTYRRWCTMGEKVETPAGPLPLVPSPVAVLDLPDEAFIEAGTKFQSRKLRAAAAAFTEHGSAWEELAPEELVKALDVVPGIRPWTAAAAAADFTGDFSVYPLTDHALRTCARRVLPGMPLPGLDHVFARRWRHFANDSRTHLHALTLYTLAWASRAHTALPSEATVAP
ncbi:hypothetical protein [Streptomyces sp. TS71-3]|uniref:hypothetical protein n=1 Tax=Streptomyces sp. TS71-3 TaxID=2733862 RepID=UPI001B29DF0A|nr:hypothetical protein [Streptomyces sp. TS71-3]GHJ34470.1 hypothetical protein Sm713_00790 [Streptomyces sp. TS71-3]